MAHRGGPRHFAYWERSGREAACCWRYASARRRPPDVRWRDIKAAGRSIALFTDARRPLPRCRARVYASSHRGGGFSRDMRIRIRVAISSLVLASIIVSAIGVHVLWWRTAETNSHELAATINDQIVAAVGKELATITTQASAAHTAIRTLFVQNVLGTREADKREFVFLSQLQSQPGI